MNFTRLRQVFPQNNTTYSFVLISLLLHILAAIVSTGYHHPDEHFQILEPMGWKLGLYGPTDLAWEFTEQIRPGLQIGLGYGVAKILIGLGIYNPFLLTAVLRQLTGLLWWALTWLLYLQWRKEFTNPLEQKALLWFSVLLWFLPYLHVRFSSESWGGLLFFYGIYMCVYFNRFRGFKYLLGGLLMGLSFYCRFQMGFAVVGFLAWNVVFNSLKIKYWAMLTMGGALSIIIGTLADFWLYGDTAFTPYNYFFQNIVAGKAAGFGVSPFYSYVTMFIEHAAPPISIVLLLFLIAGGIKAKRSVWVWVLVPFVLAHSLVGHKEFRFMFPMVALLPLLLTYGIQQSKKWIVQINPAVFSVGTKVFIGINIFLLATSLLKPANENEALFKAFYLVHQKDADTKIAFIENDPFNNGLQMNFFKYCNTCFYKWDYTEKISDSSFYIYSRKINGLPYGEHLTAKLQYSTTPIVSEVLNFGNWQERTNHGYFWEIRYEKK